MAARSGPRARTLPLFDRQPATNSGLPAVFPQNPIGVGFFDVGLGVKPFDTDLAVNGPQLLSVTREQGALKLLDDVGTFVGSEYAGGPTGDPRCRRGRYQGAVPGCSPRKASAPSAPQASTRPRCSA